MFKKLISYFVAAMLLSLSVITAMADTGINFPQFRGESGSEGITDAKTPVTAGNVSEKYAKIFGDTWNDFPGSPIIAGDSVYCLVAGQNKLYRINKNTGETIITADCNGSAQYFSMLAYGDGKVFVPRSVQSSDNTAVVLYAFDAETLKQLWISEPIGRTEDDLSAFGSVTYHDGYIYLGASNYSATKGTFACFSAKDENTQASDEVKPAIWQYAPKDGLKSGYYWCGAAVASGALVFGGEATELVSHSLSDDTVFDRLVLENNPSSGIRSTVCYDEVTRRVFVTTKSGNIYSVKLGAYNTFEKSSVIKTNLGGENTSSPVVFGGRVYVGGGGFAPANGLSVLKANDLSLIYQITDFKSQSSPVLTTAYADTRNGKRVVMYLTDYANSDLYAVTDSQNQSVQQYECIATPSLLQYCSQSIIADSEGNIYYYNDSGALFCFGQKNSDDAKYTAEDIENQIDLYAAQPVTIGMKTALERIKKRMADLENPSDVKNADVLLRIIDDVNALSDEKETVRRLNSELSVLDYEMVTLEDDLKVTNWLALYNGLSEESKSEVVYYSRLLLAVRKIEYLKNEAAVAEINRKIDTLPDEEHITLNDEEAVKAVVHTIGLQNEYVKEKVYMTKLDRLILKLAEIRLTVDTLDRMISEQLDPVLITAKNRESVAKLTDKYNALSAVNRTFVKNASTLLYAQRVLTGLDRGVIIAEVFENLYGTDLVYTYYGNGFTMSFKGTDVTDISGDYIITHNVMPATGDKQKPLKWVAVGVICLLILSLSIIFINKGKR